MLEARFGAASDALDGQDSDGEEEVGRQEVELTPVRREESRSTADAGDMNPSQRPTKTNSYASEKPGNTSAIMLSS